MATLLINIEDSLLCGALAESQDRQMSLDDFIGLVLRQALTGDSTTFAAVDIESVLENACEQVQALPKAERFHLTDLIGVEIWQAISRGERRVLGKNFRARMEQSDPPIARHIGRTSANLAIYERV